MAHRAFDRRTFLAGTVGSALVLATAGCGLVDMFRGTSTKSGRLDVALTGSRRPPRRDGVTELGVVEDRDTLLFVPASALGRRRVPVIVNLHGAGGSQEAALRRYQDRAAASGVALVLPASRARTWDAVLGAYGPDLSVIERSLDAAAERVPIDPNRLGVAGYSDGASYALSLGLTNGDVFTHVIANSPGSIPMPDPHGRPRVFVSHGTRDRVLPIGQTSDAIVPNLRADGYDVTYVRFRGDHDVPPTIAGRGVRWFLG